MDFNEERRTGIGGSDIAVIMGVSPFGKTLHELWREKMGFGVEAEMTGPMRRGAKLEHIAAEEFARETGRKLATGVQMIRHPERPYLIGHVDARQTDLSGEWTGILEIKVPSIQTYLRYKREGLADYISLQLQHYLGVSGASWGSVWIWNAELWEGAHIDMERDDQLIEMMFERAGKFWKLVEDKTPPEGEEPVPVEMPKLSGKLVQFGSDPMGAKWARATTDLQMATELKEESERIMEEAKARVVGLLEEAGATAGEGNGVRVYNHTVKGRASFDKDAALADLVVLGGWILDSKMELPDYVRKIIEKPFDEKTYRKQGEPFKQFRSYFINPKQIDI